MSEIRVCDNCNHRNDINNLECEKCGFDLSFVIPVDESELDKQESNLTVSVPDGCPTESDCANCNLVIVSMDEQITIPIHNELVIGRDGINGNYFERSNYVSRKHAIFYIENGEILIFDASTNGTFVNDKRLPKLTKTPIHSSDKITFADITFEVRYADR